MIYVCVVSLSALPLSPVELDGTRAGDCSLRRPVGKLMHARGTKTILKMPAPAYALQIAYRYSLAAQTDTTREGTTRAHSHYT